MIQGREYPQYILFIHKICTCTIHTHKTHKNIHTCTCTCSVFRKMHM